MAGINVLAVVVAAASSFLLGGLWYSKALFESAWRAAAGDSRPVEPGHPLRVFGASFGINYQFASRSTRLWMIDAGYHTVQFALYGLIIGLWR